MPHQEIETGAKGVVQLLAASANANFADKIAKALLRAGYKLDPEAFDPSRVDAVVVLWTGVALDKPALIEAAREAWKANKLTPVSIGRIEPPFASRAAAPMDLAGWRGDDGDPRWRFVLSDIDALRVRARLTEPEPETVLAPSASSPAIDPFTDDITTVHHPARALWRNRLLPAAPMAAGAAGLLLFAAGASFMVGSLSSQPAPIDNVAASEPTAPAETQIATGPALTEEEPAPGAKLALVRLAPGVAPPEDEAPTSLPVEESSDASTDIVLESLTEASPLEDDISEGEESQGLAAIMAPSLKPATLTLPDGPDAQTEVAAEALNQAALVQLAAVAEAETGVQTQQPEPTASLGESFSDCANCPDMAALSGGVFLMGARPDEQNRQPEEMPQHRVEIGYRFAIAAREVTFNQWAACVADGGCREYAPNDVGWGRGDRPVINVSHEDASAYARWLSAKTGHYYRLPSEAEWEFAARAGTGSAFHYGDALSSATANFDGRTPYRAAAGIFRGQTVPAGEFAQNAFGLFGMHGNVWEWTLDCWTPSHAGAPASGEARSDGDCARRVVKGGAWNTPGWRLRSAHRRGVYEDQRKADTGFRVVRALD